MKSQAFATYTLAASPAKEAIQYVFATVDMKEMVSYVHQQENVWQTLIAGQTRSVHTMKPVTYIAVLA